MSCDAVWFEGRYQRFGGTTFQVVTIQKTTTLLFLISDYRHFAFKMQAGSPTLRQYGPNTHCAVTPKRMHNKRKISEISGYSPKKANSIFPRSIRKPGTVVSSCACGYPQDLYSECTWLEFLSSCRLYLYNSRFPLNSADVPID
jgi:Leu/Phe-tRNA-protein transferase